MLLLKLSRSFYIAFLFLLVVAPMLIVLAFSLTDMNWHFTLHNYRNVFTNPNYVSIYERSLWVAFFTTLLCFIVAYPVSYFIAHTKNRAQSLWILLFVMPIWANFVLRTYAWIKLLGNNGLVNNWLKILGLPSVQFLYNEWAIAFGMFYNLLPFMVFPIYNALSKIDGHYAEAAQDLGASPWKIFTKITFPLSLPGVKSGIILVFIPSITFFAIADLLGGARGILLGNLINQTFFVGRDWHLGSSISVTLLLLISGVLFLLNIPSFIRKRQEWSLD